MIEKNRSSPCRLDSHDRNFRPLKQPLHVLHIDLSGRIVLVPHHLLDPGRIRVIQQDEETWESSAVSYAPRCPALSSSGLML